MFFVAAGILQEGNSISPSDNWMSLKKVQYTDIDM